MFQLSLSIDGKLAKLVLHNPPHDWLTQAFFAELGEAIAEIGRSGARAALLSAKGTGLQLRRRHRPLAGAQPARIARRVRAAACHREQSYRPVRNIQHFIEDSDACDRSGDLLGLWRAAANRIA
jgi:hypothetical protein